MREARFKAGEKYGIAPGENGELMNRSIALKNLPARGADVIADLRNPWAPVERLIVAAVRMSNTRV
ncbi:MAG: hypothetical protein QOJ41_2313 [Acidobacteriaceae bacterium]|jgi:hypothetical protein|nr:hypothetical protein [Acidobacteriaceae bacterium]